MTNTPANLRKSTERSFYLFSAPAIYVPILFGAIVAWFAPTDVLERVPQLGILVDAISGFYLPLARYVEKSSFPQVTALYFAVMILHAPMHLFYIGRSFRASLDQRRLKVLASPVKTALIDWFCNLVLFPLLVAYCLYWDVGRVLAITPLHDSRLMLGLAGWLYAGGVGFMLLGGIGHSIHERLTGKLTAREER